MTIRTYTDPGGVTQTWDGERLVRVAVTYRFPFGGKAHTVQKENVPLGSSLHVIWEMCQEIEAAHPYAVFGDWYRDNPGGNLADVDNGEHIRADRGVVKLTEEEAVRW